MPERLRDYNVGPRVLEIDKDKIINIVNTLWANNTYTIFDFDIELYGEYEFAEWMAENDLEAGTLLFDPITGVTNEELYNTFIARCIGIGYSGTSAWAYSDNDLDDNHKLIKIDWNKIDLDNLNDTFNNYKAEIKKLLKEKKGE